MTYNRITLRGYVGADPEIKYLDSQTSIASIRIATHSEGFVSQEGRMIVDQVTEWHRVLCMYDVARYAESMVRKGQLVEVQGRLSYRQHFAEGGGERKYAFVLADKVVVLTEEVHAEVQEKVAEFPNNPYGRYIDALAQDTERELPF